MTGKDAIAALRSRDPATRQAAIDLVEDVTARIRAAVGTSTGAVATVERMVGAVPRVSDKTRREVRAVFDFIETGDEVSVLGLLHEFGVRAGSALILLRRGLLPMEQLKSAAAEVEGDPLWDDLVAWATALGIAAFDLGFLKLDREVRRLARGSPTKRNAVRGLTEREEFLALRSDARPRGWALRNGRLMRELENARKRARRAVQARL